MSNQWEYPRESVEYVFFDELLIDGVVPAPGDTVEYALTTALARPLVWNTTVIPPGETRRALLLPGTLAPGKWKVWVRVPDSPENSVIEAGIITVT